VSGRSRGRINVKKSRVRDNDKETQPVAKKTDRNNARRKDGVIRADEFKKSQRHDSVGGRYKSLE